MSTLRKVLAACLVASACATANAADVGYYEMCNGEGDPDQVPPITAAGHTPIQIFDLSPGELSGLDLLVVSNCSNSGYAAEYTGALANIESAVDGGMGLVIHDRYVEGAETILPGGAGFDVRRDFGDSADINVLDASTVLTDGIDDTTLDGGNSSSHGYAVVGTLPGDGLFLLSRSNPDEIVSFAYPFGGGGVYYSSIPLDFYLGGAGNNPPADAFRNIYAVNAVNFGLGIGSGVQRGPAIPVPTLGGLGLLLMALMLAGVAAVRLRAH